MLQTWMSRSILFANLIFLINAAKVTPSEAQQLRRVTIQAEPSVLVDPVPAVSDGPEMMYPDLETSNSKGNKAGQRNHRRRHRNGTTTNAPKTEITKSNGGKMHRNGSSTLRTTDSSALNVTRSTKGKRHQNRATTDFPIFTTTQNYLRQWELDVTWVMGGGERMILTPAIIQNILNDFKVGIDLNQIYIIMNQNSRNSTIAQLIQLALGDKVNDRFYQSLILLRDEYLGRLGQSIDSFPSLFQKYKKILLNTDQTIDQLYYQFGTIYGPNALNSRLLIELAAVAIYENYQSQVIPFWYFLRDYIRRYQTSSTTSAPFMRSPKDRKKHP